MEAEYNHLNHATWECKYGTTEGVPDRGGPLDARSCSHADIDTPEVFGGADHRAHERKSSIWIAQKCRRQDEKFPGPQIPGSRIFCPTVGRDEEMIRAYIRNQELADQQLDQLELKISAAPKSKQSS